MTGALCPIEISLYAMVMFNGDVQRLNGYDRIQNGYVAKLNGDVQRLNGYVQTGVRRLYKPSFPPPEC